MARVTCRCGETLKVTSGDPDRLTCPRCGAKIRVRRSPSQQPEAIELGGRLSAIQLPLRQAAEGPELMSGPKLGNVRIAGAIVPVPESGWTQTAGVRSRLEKPGAGRIPLRARKIWMQIDLERLERWASRFQAGHRITTSNQAPSPRRHIRHWTPFPDGSGPEQRFACNEDGGRPSGLPPLRQTLAHERHRLPLVWRARAQAIAESIRDSQRTRFHTKIHYCIADQTDLH